MNYPNLFSPVTLRGVTFPNRIMRTSMVSGLATEDGHVTEDLKKRYQREAQGGVGSIVVEAAVVPPSRSSYNLRISDDSFVDELKGLVQTVRKANPETKLGIQIMHFLKIAKSGWRQRVTDFKKEDLPVIVDLHVKGARRAIAAGFDFIELHMAHAYTLSSFLSLSNERTDEYGGSLQNRMRLPMEVYQAVRKEVGERYPLGVRINGEDFTIKGTTLLPQPETPPDPMSGYSGHRMSPEWWFPDATHVYLAEGVRKVVREAGHEVSVVTAGKIRMPQQAEEILASGKADMIGLCRALLCDPDWPLKAKDGRAKDIVSCTACNWCLEADSRMEKVNCSRWPEGSLVAPTTWTKKDARASALSKTAEGE
jgi:2,4-dienoyl-CoA reductase-like NADH-dependent reductase (Old Yellow Enzyme family)